MFESFVTQAQLRELLTRPSVCSSVSPQSEVEERLETLEDIRRIRSHLD